MSDTVYTYGERQPDGDHYSIFTRLDGSIVARFMSREMEAEFLARYTQHDLSCRWSYAAPDGAEVV